MEAELEWTWQAMLSKVVYVLNYQLFQIDNSGISVGKLITGIVLLILGYFVAARAAAAFDRRVLSRLTLDESLRYTFHRLIFYFLFIVISLFVLRSLNVPITIFTVVGGALAVGVGFGSQNVINNFISGILVMVGRPARIGDFIEIDGVSGTVITIGIRSTTVQTTSNAAVVIPNTSLIEKNLINWSYSHTVSDLVRIGVAYGTDLALLKKICFEAVEAVEGILNPKETVVIFADFGDNALLFDIVYNISPSRYPTRRRIQSDIRFRLNELFIKHSVSVPFPQRDIHIVDASIGVLQSRIDA